MSYSSNHKGVAKKRPAGVFVGLFVVCAFLSFVSGCVVTSVGGKPGCAKCGRQGGQCQRHGQLHSHSHGNPYTPTKVTQPEPGGTEVPNKAGVPAKEEMPAPMEMIVPQSSSESKGWQPIVSMPKDVPVQTVSRSAPIIRANTRPWYDPWGLFTHSQLAPPKTIQQVGNRETSPPPTLPPKPPVLQEPSPDPVKRLPATSSKRLPIREQLQAITQVSYDTPASQPIPQATRPQTVRTPAEPKRLPAATPPVRVNVNSQANPELHKPWNMDEFRPYSVVAAPPYRLVSDAAEQDGTNRSAPPNIDIRRLTGGMSSSTTNASLAQNTESPYQRMPIFGLGRELVKEFQPSNDRKWSQNHAVLQTASFNGNYATVHNVRYSKYEGGKITSTRYYDATFNLNDIRTIDLVIVPFRGAPRLAHVQASFGFADGRHIGMSIEARYEEGEIYDALGSTMRQFELIYVFADERDLLRIGSEVNKNDVHLYRLKFEPSEVREMFVDALNRANKLAEKPEFYHPLRNSCVTNLIAHINKGRPKAVPKEYRTLLPGLLDNYAYDLKLVDTTAKTFKEAKENAKVNWLVEKFGDLEYFSAGIRQNMY